MRVSTAVMLADKILRRVRGRTDLMVLVNRSGELLDGFDGGSNNAISGIQGKEYDMKEIDSLCHEVVTTARGGVRACVSTERIRNGDASRSGNIPLHPHLSKRV